MQTRIHSHIRSNVVGYVAVFLALSGTAAATHPGGADTIDSADIINAEVNTQDLANNSVSSDKINNGAVRSADVADDTTANALKGIDIANASLTGADVADNSLTGADVQESSLGQVPSALFGGFGRSASQSAGCDPESLTLQTCVSVGLNLPAPARVLLVGRVTGNDETGSAGSDSGHGTCQLGTSVTGGLSGSGVTVRVVETIASGVRFPVGGATSLVAVTPPLGPGPVSFGIDCNQHSQGAIFYDSARIAALAISSN